MKRPGFPTFIMTALCGCVAGWFIGPVMRTGPMQDTGSPNLRSRSGNHQRPTASPVDKPAEKAYFRIHLAGLPPSVVASALHRGLFKEIEGLPVGEYCYCEMLTLAVADAAKKNPTSIFDDLVASRDDRMDGLLMAGLFETWTTEAPHAAIDAVQGLPQGPRKNALRTALLQALTLTHPQLAMTLYKESGHLTDRLQSYDLVTDLFSNLAKSDLSAARREFSGMPQGPDHNNVARVLATHMAAENAQTAMQWATVLTDPKEKETAFGDILRQVSRQNPTSFEALLAGIEDPAIRASAVFASFRPLAKHDPALLERLIDGNLTGNDQSVARSNLIGSIDNPADFPLVTRILDKQPPGKNRNSLVAGFAGHWGGISPQQTHDWLTAAGEWQRVPEETRQQITRRMANGNRPDTVKW